MEKKKAFERKLSVTTLPANRVEITGDAKAVSKEIAEKFFPFGWMIQPGSSRIISTRWGDYYAVTLYQPADYQYRIRERVKAILF